MLRRGAAQEISLDVGDSARDAGRGDLPKPPDYHSELVVSCCICATRHSGNPGFEVRDARLRLQTAFFGDSLATAPTNLVIKSTSLTLKAPLKVRRLGKRRSDRCPGSVEPVDL